MSPPSLELKSKPSNKQTGNNCCAWCLWILGSDVNKKKYIHLMRELLERLRMGWRCHIKIKNLRERYYEVK
jgi:hypothetical protein